MDKQTGGAAFPTSHSPDYPHEINGGMTLRDYFAAQALATIAGYPANDVAEWMPRHFAGHVYAIADAMLVERAK